MLRCALDALTLRPDGSRAAANTIIRKRAALHGALGYAAEAGLLPDNPLDTIGWQVPQWSAVADPMTMASPWPKDLHQRSADRSQRHAKAGAAGGGTGFDLRKQCGRCCGRRCVARFYSTILLAKPNAANGRGLNGDRWVK